MNKESIILQLKELTKSWNISFDEDILSKAVVLAQFSVFPKGTILKSIGDKAQQTAFVLDGLVRCYYIDGDGNDITRGFGFDGGMCMDEGLMGLHEHICMWENVEESTLMLFDISELKNLIMSSESLKTIWIGLLENALNYKIYRESSFLTENATERYLNFRKHYPQLCDRVPQKHIATYLGITPESLSRIRKTMREE